MRLRTRFDYKKDRVNHVYTEPNDIWYVPRAAVTYRWYKWIWVWGNIIVKKWLKPRVLTESAWKFVLFRDVSLWEIEKSTTCLSFVDCQTNKDWYLMDTKKLLFLLLSTQNTKIYSIGRHWRQIC